MPRRAPSVRRLRRAVLLLCSIAVAVPAIATPAVASPADTDARYEPPVDAPVVDPFRPPSNPYGSGNRGLEYGTAPHTPVRAAADGRVTFAGLVAGTRHVTVHHADGLRTSYSFLARIDVAVGQRISRGHVVGTTVDHLHFGVRAGDAYLDPASLFEPGPPKVRLVPFDEPPGDGPDGERSAISQLIGGIGGVLGRAESGLRSAASVADWLRDEGLQLARTFAHYGVRFTPPMALVGAVTTGLGALAAARAAAERPCTEDDAPALAPTERRVALLVAGLGSTSAAGAIDDIDTTALGYDPPDVLRYSYAGGRTPDTGDGFGAIAASEYDAADSQQDLRAAGERLADLVESVAAAAPTAPVDLYAHSQGGLVARLAIIELERRHGTAWLRHLGLVATLGTPHGGADLATGIHGVASGQAGSVGLDLLAGALDLELDDDAPAVAQLSETSEVVATLQRTPIPDAVRAVSIAARGDLVVPVPRAAAPGATEVVVPVVGTHAHDQLPGSPEAARELALALSGLPPACQSFTSALTDQLVGAGISWAEDTVGAAAWAAVAPLGLQIPG